MTKLSLPRLVRHGANSVITKTEQQRLPFYDSVTSQKRQLNARNTR